MKQRKADIMLHPVRMRIIQSLITNKPMTSAQLINELEDVPQATMYRQLKHLLDADLIEIVETNKIRGTTEKVYAVKRENLAISEKELNEASVEEHVRYFMTYQANLLKEFEKYVLKHNPNQFKEDGLGYWQMSLHLSEQEMNEFGKEMQQVLEKYASNEPSDQRKTRTFATIFIPQK
ncbi:hypothetical protein JCM9140_3713 [Halalkalibacter wakoensis JCM 9140]|uniref:HTH arsR-type domain-containing protein n=1 Tax=Halalkalibacter wakoensis JCM 9140 TaxID=1236970 RepID=W4Q661_9BACI|nr:helix-turn-helix domain-containing protein [Halalkalibacter wakoensis]GAE27561.1 hypothetical protein JCM9140_3713 [Halalkalibacter wakoensis JCM 9140]